MHPAGFYNESCFRHSNSREAEKNPSKDSEIEKLIKYLGPPFGYIFELGIHPLRQFGDAMMVTLEEEHGGEKRLPKEVYIVPSGNGNQGWKQEINDAKIEDYKQITDQMREVCQSNCLSHIFIPTVEKMQIDKIPPFYKVENAHHFIDDSFTDCVLSQHARLPWNILEPLFVQYVTFFMGFQRAFQKDPAVHNLIFCKTDEGRYGVTLDLFTSRKENNLADFACQFGKESFEKIKALSETFHVPCELKAFHQEALDRYAHETPLLSFYREQEIYVAPYEKAPIACGEKPLHVDAIFLGYDDVIKPESKREITFSDFLKRIAWALNQKMEEKGRYKLMGPKSPKEIVAFRNVKLSPMGDHESPLRSVAPCYWLSRECSIEVNGQKLTEMASNICKMPLSKGGKKIETIKGFAEVNDKFILVRSMWAYKLALEVLKGHRIIYDFEVEHGSNNYRIQA